MSVNGLSTAVGERNSPNLNEISSSVRNAETTDSQVRPLNVERQELTKPATPSSRVELSEQAQPKVIANSADNKESVVNGQGLEAANEQLKSEDQLLQSLQKLADSSNQLAQMQDRKLEFSTSQESGRTVVRVIDKESDDVIRQIPSEEFIRVAEKISDLSEQVSAAQGLLFESKV